MPLPLSHLIPGQELPPSLVSPLNHPTRALPALFTCVPLFSVKSFTASLPLIVTSVTSLRPP
jgi:hypothetical protein